MTLQRDEAKQENARLRAEVERLRGAISLALDEVCCMGPKVILEHALAQEDVLMPDPKAVSQESWSARVATDLAKVAQDCLAEGATAAHAEVAADTLARASRYAKDAAREIRLFGPPGDDEVHF